MHADPACLCAVPAMLDDDQMTGNKQACIDLHADISGSTDFSSLS